MLYSYTQISQYLSCPRRYRHRYLDGWVEKDIRPAMLFGRAFEKALSAYFLRQDSAAVFYQEWAVHREQPLQMLANSYVAAKDVHQPLSGINRQPWRHRKS